jgi:predicted nucleic-acid-binding Zn-ribbon protein
MAGKFQAEGAEHIVEGICHKCHHINYYDKRVICTGEIRERNLDDQKLDQILVTCEECGEKMVIKVDCRGYV